jgi:riboflavin synthase
MFTGIVAGTGRVKAVRPTNRDLRIEIETALDLADAEIGASILHAGCCMTLIDKSAGWFAVEASNETIALTTAGRWRAGTEINLERPQRAGSELGGHVVTGHVDGVGEIVSLAPDGGSYRARIRVPDPLHRFIAKKSSVAVDGVSLTVVDVHERTFDIAIIPHTWDTTTLHYLQCGSVVNVETDILARYLARWMETQILLGSRTPHGSVE